MIMWSFYPPAQETTGFARGAPFRSYVTSRTAMLDAVRLKTERKEVIRNEKERGISRFFSSYNLS